jgi:hypothetical protein
MADSTGMKQAQTRDPAVGNFRRAAGAVGGVAKKGWANRPFSRSRKRLIAGDEERTKLEARDQYEEEKKGRATKGADSSDVANAGLHGFNKILINALRRGNVRAEGYETSDDLIRTVMCQDQFIAIVRNQDQLPTPLEEASPKYKEQMVKVRERLAGMLKRRTVEEISADDLDIIYVSLIGLKSVMVRGETAEFWGGWNAECPSPPEAFFAFLENVAKTENQGKEGEYIGSILKQLSERKSLTTDAKLRVQRALVDPNYVDTYLEQKSNEPIERTVDEFRTVVHEIMQTPSNEIHVETGVPGLGLEQVSKEAVEQAAEPVNQLKPKVEEAQATLQAAKQKRAEAAERIKQARDKGEITDDKEAQVKALEEGLNREVEAAEQNVIHLIGLLQGVSAAYKEASDKRKFFGEKLTEFETAFRRKLLEANDAGLLKEMPETMKWAEYPKITLLLDDVEEALSEKESLIQALANERGPQIKDGGFAKTIEQVAKESFEKEWEELNAKINKLAEDVKDSELPEEVKKELQKIVEATRNMSLPKGYVEEKSVKFKNKYAYPAREAARLAIKKLEDGSIMEIGEISETQWVIAKTIWEKTGEKVEALPMNVEGLFDRIAHGFYRTFFTLDVVGWIAGKIYTITTLRVLVKNLIKERRQVIPRIGNDNKKTYKMFGWFDLRRWHVGLIHAITLGYVVGTGIYGYYASPGLRAHYTASVPQNTRFAWDGHTRLYQPWTWVTGVDTPQTHRRIINDSKDDYTKLASRGEQFYRDNYGVRGEENLEWVAENPEVLRFFQERRSLIRVKSEPRERPINTPETCSTKKVHIPETCKASPFSFENDDDVAAFEAPDLVTDEGWVPNKAMPVCCLLEMDTEQITDGLKLNRHKSNEFVNYLRTQQGEESEKGGAKIDGAFLRDTKNMITWNERRFLITEQQDEAMERFEIIGDENVDFAVAQKTMLTTLMLPLVNRGEAERFVKTEHREEFLAAWRSEISSGEGTPNPLSDEVPEETMRATFAKVMTKAGESGWDEDCTTEYRLNQAEKAMSQLNLQLQPSKDAFVAQPDIRELLEKFVKNGALYKINTGRSDQFVQLLVRHKESGGSVSDYDPFAEPRGRSAQGAINAGYIYSAEDMESTETKAGPTKAEQTKATSQFYSDERFTEWTEFLDATFERLYDDQESLQKLYGGDRTRTETAVKGEVLRVLEGTSKRSAKLRKGWGVKIVKASVGEGEEAHEEITEVTFDARRARKGLSSHIMTFARANRDAE